MFERLKRKKRMSFFNTQATGNEKDKMSFFDSGSPEKKKKKVSKKA
jgi:hypothetical protein